MLRKVELTLRQLTARTEHSKVRSVGILAEGTGPGREGGRQRVRNRPRNDRW